MLKYQMVSMAMGGGLIYTINFVIFGSFYSFGLLGTAPWKTCDVIHIWRPGCHKAVTKLLV